MWSTTIFHDGQKISVPSIYRKVLQLSEKGYLHSNIVKGDKFADKAIYSITDQGRAYFKELMAACAAGPVPLLFDFNVVITNLNKMDKAEALELVSTLRRSIQSSVEANEGYARELQTFLWLDGRKSKSAFCPTSFLLAGAFFFLWNIF